MKIMTGYFENKECADYLTFKKVAMNLLDNCFFCARFG